MQKPENDVIVEIHVLLYISDSYIKSASRTTGGPRD